MNQVGYTMLMKVRDEGHICETTDDERVFVMERSKRNDFDNHDEGYPITRTTLEYCVGWEVEKVHIYAEEEEESNQYIFDIEEYLDARFKPVYDNEFSTAPLVTSLA